MPTLIASEDFQLKAVYSIFQDEAEALAKGANVEAYFGLSKDSNHSLDALLKREDIQALFVDLPLDSRAEVIRRGLNAGKHILSQPPIAQNVKTAQETFEDYANLCGNALWGVGENFRFKQTILFASKLVQSHGSVEKFTFDSSGYISSK